MTTRRRSVTNLTMYALAYAVLVFLVTPILLIVPMSIGENRFLEFPPTGFTWAWYNEYLTDPGWIDPTILSFQIAILVALLSGVLGTASAYAVVRGGLPGLEIVRLMILSPIVVPNIVIAIGMFFLFAELRMLGNIWAFTLAHTVLALPYVFLTVGAALQKIDASLELAAMSLGATRWAAFRLVTLPLLTPAVVSGGLFAFIISFDESVVSYFISGTRDKTLPRRLFENLEYTITPTVAAVSTLLIALSIVVLSLVWLVRRADRIGGNR